MVQIEPQDVLQRRPFTLMDVSDSYLETLNNKEYMVFSRQSSLTHSRETVAQYLSQFDFVRSYFFAFSLASSGVLVGTSTVYKDIGADSADLGVLVLQEFCNQGS